MVHENSQKKIMNLLKKTLDITEVRRNNISFPSVGFDAFEQIASEFNKRKDSNIKLDKFKCISIYEDALLYYMADNNKLVIDDCYKFITEPNKQPILDFIYSFFTKLPINYKVYIHLKNVMLPENSKSQYIETINYKCHDIDGEEITGTKIGLNITGFYDWRDRAPFIREITYNLNIFIFLLVKFELICHYRASVWTKNYKIDYNGIELLNIEQVKVGMKSFSHPFVSSDFNLELSLSKYLNELSSVTICFDADEVNNTLCTVCKLTEEIIIDKTTEAARIKFAIDWYMQSLFNDDSVMSFIQLCIGLESIYGDDNYEGSLTKSLADRCAYLIGKSIPERKKIQSNIKEIYTFRSKVIHGVVFSHDSKFEEMRDQATFYLSESINMELKSMGWLC